MNIANAPIDKQVDSGIFALMVVALHFRVPTDPTQLAHDMGLGQRTSSPQDLVRAARRLGLRAALKVFKKTKALQSVPMPCIVGLEGGGFRVAVRPLPDGGFLIGDPVTRITEEWDRARAEDGLTGEVIIVGRRWRGVGVDPKTFGFAWFFSSIWRYRRPMSHVVFASLVVQLFALSTPILFQVLIDKVLAHKGYSTLSVITFGLAGIAIFDAILQFLRSYTLTHTTNRIDVELGSRLFDHLVRLPLSYFSSRPTGQTIARVRELETVRNFFTGQGLTSILDLFFAVIFISVLFFYSSKLALIALLSLPLYVVTAASIRPLLRTRIEDQFSAGAQSQQFLVETVVGIETLKASAVEPMLRNEWEARLAAFVKSSFDVAILSSLGQALINLFGKLASVAVLFFGALAVIDGEMSLGALIAFNMLLGQVTAPILRLSMLWQDFQQVKISVERMSDVLNAPTEPQSAERSGLPQGAGAIKLSEVSFRYRPDTSEVLSDVSLEISAGEMVGFFGPSGSGKSTLTKLIQGFYRPERGRITIDGIDVSQADTVWVRRQIGVVLQENMLFNRSIHENIAIANPGLPRAGVVALARIAGADEFISSMPAGYDTIIEERGTNLSGGQRQRIAIARALATNPRILILDEATSALDYESERIIRNNMRLIGQGRTVIVIAHRLSALRKCQRIIGLVNGRIAEIGTHASLQNSPGSLYARLWQSQSSDNE